MKYESIKAGKVKTYTHEIYRIWDSNGNVCEIRCSFDKERFFLRSVGFIDKNGKHTSINIVALSNKVTEFVYINWEKLNESNSGGK